MSDLKLQYTEDHLQVVDSEGNVLEEVYNRLAHWLSRTPQ
jgi:hypothetical protein